MNHSDTNHSDTSLKLEGTECALHRTWLLCYRTRRALSRLRQIGHVLLLVLSASLGLGSRYPHKAKECPAKDPVDASLSSMLSSRLYDRMARSLRRRHQIGKASSPSCSTNQLSGRAENSCQGSRLATSDCCDLPVIVIASARRFRFQLSSDFYILAQVMPPISVAQRIGGSLFPSLFTPMDDPEALNAPETFRQRIRRYVLGPFPNRRYLSSLTFA